MNSSEYRRQLRQQRQLRHSIAWAGVVAVAGAAYAWLAPVSHAGASETREFSSEESALLRAGKLVVRAEQRTTPNSHLLGGLSWQVINATPAATWRAMTDVRAYPRFLPAVEEARLLEVVGPTQTVSIRHRLGFITADYCVRVVEDAARGRIRFRLDHDHPSSIRDAWGELSVSAYPNHQSVVSLAIMADLGEGLIVGLVRANVHEWMLRVPEQLKRYVESHRS
jgi:ribosome-associated toxin RatA of RatAB toxin-antitoxin module